MVRTCDEAGKGVEMEVDALPIGGDEGWLADIHVDGSFTGLVHPMILSDSVVWREYQWQGEAGRWGLIAMLRLWLVRRDVV